MLGYTYSSNIAMTTPKSFLILYSTSSSSLCELIRVEKEGQELEVRSDDFDYPEPPWYSSNCVDSDGSTLDIFTRKYITGGSDYLPRGALLGRNTEGSFKYRGEIFCLYF